jgi:subtilisin family serine protease
MQSQKFKEATGKGVKVAVIDSGVNRRHPHVNGVAGGVAIGLEDAIDSCVDFLGHGTAVLAAIKEKAPQADYYAVKIYYRALRTDIPLLVEAIDWSIDHEMDVINLSLGTINLSHRDEIAGTVKRALDAGIALVAPRRMGSSPAYPGSMEGVTAVDLDWSCPRECFRRSEREGESEWLAAGYPRSLPGVDPARNIKGISFSVANMTGFVAKARQLKRDGSRYTLIEILENEADPI